MAPLYQARSPIGTRKEIPFEGHKPVRVIVNYPRRTTGNDLYPVYINVHGGAFAEGDAVTMDSFCQKVADELGILVINLNYRLFPEAYFPYPVQELDVLLDEVAEQRVDDDAADNRYDDDLDDRHHHGREGNLNPGTGEPPG